MCILMLLTNVGSSHISRGLIKVSSCKGTFACLQNKYLSLYPNKNRRNVFYVINGSSQKFLPTLSNICLSHSLNNIPLLVVNNAINSGLVVNYSSSITSNSPIMLLARGFHFSACQNEKEKSKVEKTVDALKESIKAKKDTNIETTDVKSTLPTSPKKTLGQRIWAEIVHYYHGFRLLFIDISVSATLLWKILKGNSLTRREHRLLVQTVSDIFRLVPFSVFIIVPFMELLLPVFIKLFPNMLPSTFQSSDDREAKMKKSLKVKLEMAKFLQVTLDEMGVQTKGDKKSETAREFSQFFEQIRSSGQQASNEDIIRFSKLFEDEITLDSLNRQQLIALCKLLELQPFGTTNFLNFQLRMRLRNLKADDKLIKKEGIENLTTLELQQACKARGMRAYGVSDERMRSQLEQWLELSLDEKIPPSLLLLSRALYIPEALPQPDQLKATISTLPDSVAAQAKAKIGEVEGKVDNKTKIEIIRQEQKQIKKEKEEKILQEAAEVTKATLSPGGQIAVDAHDEFIDRTPTLKDMATEVGADTDFLASDKREEISRQDLDVIEDALENISAEKRNLLIEKEELQDLKEELADYKEDVEEFKDVMVLSGMSENDIRLNKASTRLYKQVNRMICKMDHIISDLEKKGHDLKLKIKNGDGHQEKEQKELVSIDEVIQAMRKLQTRPSRERMEKIATVLQKIDDDHDGVVEVDDVLQVIELLGKEDVKLSDEMLSEIMSLLEKEESLEFAERIEKVVEREEQHKKATEAKLGSLGASEDKVK